jgi:DNA-binding LacI/PurR family transcriptional regulator
MWLRRQLVPFVIRMTAPRQRVLLILHWYSEALHEGALKYGVERGLDVVLASVESLATVPAGSFDGVLCALPPADHPFTRFVAGATVPVVELSQAHPEYTSWGRYPSDHEVVGRLAANHLRGRPVAGFVFTSFGPWPSHDARWGSFRKALANDSRPCVRVDADRGNPEPLTRFVEFLKTTTRPVGIFGSVDESALLALEAARMAGLRVPGDAYIIGFGSRQLVSGLAPVPITSIDIDYRAWAYDAMAMLHGMMAGTLPPGARRTFAPGPLIERASTGGDSVGDPLCARALNIMRGRVSDPLDVSALSRELGVSASTLQRAFDTTFGTGVAARYLALRLDIAKGLLSSGLKVDAVAGSVGFSSPRAFRSAFRNAFACSPVEFVRGISRR